MRSMIRPFLLVTMLCILVTVNCKPGKPSVGARGTPVSAEQDEDMAVVARIGDRDITIAEIKERLDAMPVYVRLRYRSKERRREFLESYVQFQVLALEAQRAGYGTDPEVVDILKSEVVGRFLSDRVNSRVSSDDISDQQVESWYESHHHHFNRPRQVRVSHVLVKDHDMASKVLFRAKKLCHRPGADPREEFSKLVIEHSEDEATKNSSGDIGLFPRVGTDTREVPPEVEDGAEGLEDPFELSELIEADDGFHILFVYATVPPVDKSLDNARAEIVPLLMERERERLRGEFIRGLMDEAEVKIDRDAVERVIEASIDGEGR